MKPRPKRRLEFWVAVDQYLSLQSIEENTGAPIAAQIRIAIDEYLAKRIEASNGEERKDGKRGSTD